MPNTKQFLLNTSNNWTVNFSIDETGKYSYKLTDRWGIIYQNNNQEAISNLILTDVDPNLVAAIQSASSSESQDELFTNYLSARIEKLSEQNNRFGLTVLTHNNEKILYIGPYGLLGGGRFLGALGGVALVASGVALTVFTGGLAGPALVAATAGSSALIGSGISGTVYSVTTSDTEFKATNYVKQSAIGLISGVATAGLGSGVGELGKIVAPKLLGSAASVAAKTGAEQVMKVGLEAASKVGIKAAGKVSEVAVQKAASVVVEQTIKSGVKVLASASTGVGSGLVNGAVSSAVHNDSKHIKAAVTPSRIISSAAGSVLASGASEFVSGRADEITRKAAKGLFGNADQLGDFTADAIEVAAAAASGGAAGAAGAAASTVVGNAIQGQDLTQGMGEAMITSGFSGVITGTANGAKNLPKAREMRKEAKWERQAKLEAKKVEADLKAKEEKANKAKQELKKAECENEIAKRDEEKAKQALDAVEQEANRNEQEHAKLREQYKEKQKILQETEKQVSDAEQNQQSLNTEAELAKKDFENREQQYKKTEEQLQNAEKTEVQLKSDQEEADRILKEKQQALVQADEDLIKAEKDLSSAVQQEQKQAEQKAQALREQLASKEHQIKSLEAEKKEHKSALQKIGSDISKTWKKGLKDIRAERSRALDKIQKNLGPLEHDFKNLRRELAQAEQTARQIGKDIDREASKTLKPLRDARTQLSKEIETAVHKVESAGQKLDKFVSNELKPLRDARDDARRGIEHTAKQAESLSKKAEKYTSERLKPVREARDSLNKEVGKLTEQVKETGRAIEQQVSQQLEPARDLRRQAGNRLDSAAAVVKEKAAQFETQVAKELKPAMQLRDQARRGVEDAGAKAASATKTYADAVKNDISKAGKAIHAPIKAETDRLQKKFVDPVTKAVDHAGDVISKTTRPVSKAIEKTAAPVLKNVVKAQVRATTLGAECALKVAGEMAGALGNKHAKKDLLAAADGFSRAAKATGESIAENGGKIVTAKNAALLAKSSVKLATTTNPTEHKKITDDLQHAFVDPTVDTLRTATKEMSDATRPLTKPIEDKVAPVLKKGLEHAVRGTTASTEGAMKAVGAIAGATGDKATQRKLNKAADKLSKASHKTAEEVAEASGKIVTAKNAARVAATVIGTAYGGPAGGAAALSVVQVAQGDKVTGKDIAINVVASYASAGASAEVAGMMGKGVGSTIAAGAAGGATRNVVNHSLHAVAENKPITFTDLRDQAVAGAAAGTAGAGMGVALGSDAGIGGEVIKSGTTAATENAVRQYQTTGEVDLQKAAVAFGAGAMNAGFTSAVEAMIPNEIKPQLKTTKPQADKSDAPEVPLPAQKADDPITTQSAEPKKSPWTGEPKKDWLRFMPTESEQAPVPYRDGYNPNDKKPVSTQTYNNPLNPKTKPQEAPAQSKSAPAKPAKDCVDLDLKSMVIWPNLTASPPAKQSPIPYKEGFFPKESSELCTAPKQKPVTNPNKDPDWLNSDRKGRAQPNPIPQGREDKDDFLIKRGIPNKSNATKAQRGLNSIGEGDTASGNKKSDSLKGKQTYKEAVNRNRGADIVRPTEPNPQGFWQKSPVVAGGIIDLINIFGTIEQNIQQSGEEIMKTAIPAKFGGCDSPVLQPDDHYLCGQEKYQKLKSEWQARTAEIQRLTGEDYSGDINKILWQMSAEKRQEFEAKTDAYIQSLESKQSSNESNLSM